ncbi:hypothetical protein [Actinophytocola sediminis]
MAEREHFTDDVTEAMIDDGVAAIESVTVGLYLGLDRMVVDGQPAKRVLVYEAISGVVRGRRIVELPAPDEAHDNETFVWRVSGEDRWSSTVEAYVDEVGPVVVCDRGELGAVNARALGLALLAAAERAEDLVAESPDAGADAPESTSGGAR